MHVIYEPKGAAREYARWACNLYTGCNHGCTYCYCPKLHHKSRERWAEDVRPRDGILASLKKDVLTLAARRQKETDFFGCPPRDAQSTQKRVLPRPDDILFSFMGDPYWDGDNVTTGNALRILGAAGLRATVLTKGGMRAARDFEVLRKHGFSFGTTLTTLDRQQALEWEPGAARPNDRIEAIHTARMLGIKCWVSLEPVIDFVSAQDVINELHDYVDWWWIGKINHAPDLEKKVDWTRFVRIARAKLDGYGAQYRFKTSLAAFEGNDAQKS